MITFKRYAPGLYVDPSETWVISRESDGCYSIRALLGYGETLSGETMPDYGSVWYGDHWLLADAKADIQRMVADNFQPNHANETTWYHTA